MCFTFSFMLLSVFSFIYISVDVELPRRPAIYEGVSRPLDPGSTKLTVGKMVALVAPLTTSARFYVGRVVIIQKDRFQVRWYDTKPPGKSPIDIRLFPCWHEESGSRQIWTDWQYFDESGIIIGDFDLTSTDQLPSQIVKRIYDDNRISGLPHKVTKRRDIESNEVKLKDAKSKRARK